MYVTHPPFMSDLTEELEIPLYAYKDGEEHAETRNIDIGYENKRQHGHIRDEDWIKVASAIVRIHTEHIPYYVSTVNKEYSLHQLAIDIDGEHECNDEYLTSLCALVSDILRRHLSSAFRQWHATCMIAKRVDRPGRYHLHWGGCHVGPNTLLEITRAVIEKDKDVDINYAKQGCLRTIYVPKIERIDNKWMTTGVLTAYEPYRFFVNGALVAPETITDKRESFKAAVDSVGMEMALVCWSMVGIPTDVAAKHWKVVQIPDKRKRERATTVEDEMPDDDDPMRQYSNKDFRNFSLADDNQFYDEDFHVKCRELIADEPRGSPELMTYLASRFAVCGKDVYRKNANGLDRVGSIRDLMFPADLILQRKSFTNTKKKTMGIKEFFLNWAYHYQSTPAYIPRTPGYDIPHDELSVLNKFRGIAAYTNNPYAVDWDEVQDDINYIFWASWIRFFSCDTKMCWMFWNWVASITQQPKKKTQRAFILRSAEGTGKSDLINRIAHYILGRHNVWSTSNSMDITGGYSYWADYLLIELSENIMQDDAAMNRLKDLITNEESSCNLKFKDPSVRPNYVNFIVTSNSNACLKIDSGPTAGRRWIVPQILDFVPTEYSFTFERWNTAWQRAGNAFAVLIANAWHLGDVFEYQLSDMRTKTRRELRRNSMSFVQTAYLDWITAGKNYFVDGKALGWHVVVPIQQVIKYFTQDRRYRVKGLDALYEYGVETRGDSFVFPHTQEYAEEWQKQLKLEKQYDEARVSAHAAVSVGAHVRPVFEPPGYINPSFAWYPFQTEAKLRAVLHDCLKLAREKFMQVECDFDFTEQEPVLVHWENSENFIAETSGWYRYPTLKTDEELGIQPGQGWDLPEYNDDLYFNVSL